MIMPFDSVDTARLDALEITEPLSKGARAIRLGEVLRRAAQGEPYYVERGRVREDDLTRSAWRRGVCREVAALVEMPLPDDFDGLVDERIKLTIRSLLARACRLLLRMEEAEFRDSSAVPHFLRRPDEARCSNVLEADPGRLRLPDSGEETELSVVDSTRSSAENRLRTFLRAVAVVPERVADRVHEGHLAILTDRVADLCRFNNVDVLGTGPADAPLQDRMRSTFVACAHAVGVSEADFARDADCPSILRSAWESGERLRVHREQVVRVLGVLRVEERKRADQKQRDPSAYRAWQLGALNRLREVVGSGSDWENLREATARVLGVSSESFVTNTSGMPDFLAEGLIEAVEPAWPSSLSPALQALLGRQRVRRR